MDVETRLAMIDPTPRVVRRGSGFPLILVHGSGVDHRLLMEVDGALGGPAGCERIYIDLPGFGGTPSLHDPGDFPQLVRWFAQAAAELTEGRAFAMVGNSMGCLLVRDFVARHMAQCMGFALLAPVIDPERDHRTLPPREVLARDPELLASLDSRDRDAYSALAVVQSPENWRRFGRSVLPGIRAADNDASQRLESGYGLPTVRQADWKTFDRPVLVVTGRQDAAVGYEDQYEFARLLPRSTYAVLDPAGHNVQIERHAVVCALLGDWLNRIRNENPL